MRNFTEQELVRRSKLEVLKSKGIDPFGERFDFEDNTKDLHGNYEQFDKEQLVEKNIPVKIAGRIMTKRGKGKAGFVHLQDKYGQIQLYIKQDAIGEELYEVFDMSDLGDIIGVEGILMRTNMGELSIKVEKFQHLVKALRPLPEKYHGLTDVEERFRRRYVDLIMNDNARRIAFERPKIIRLIQKFLDDRGYVEVETPVLGTILGGAEAKPFVTHHNTLDIDMYLRIATELPLKRLIVGGMDAVYEIGRLFRNEGMSRKHNPEFTTVELYKAYVDMYYMMDLFEDLFRYIGNELYNRLTFNWHNHEINFEPKFKRIHMVDAIKEVTGIDFWNKDFEEAKKLAEENDIFVEKHYAFGHIVNEFFETFVEETIVQPTFIYGHPIEVSPLAKKSKDERFTERFELFIGASEFGNSFTELNDPDDQYERFLNQVEQKELGNEETSEMDLDFVEALEYGMPPSGGLGIGIDRLIMLFTETDTIREVILFPTMKNKD